MTTTTTAPPTCDHSWHDAGVRMCWVLYRVADLAPERRQDSLRRLRLIRTGDAVLIAADDAQVRGLVLAVTTTAVVARALDGQVVVVDIEAGALTVA